MVMAVRFHQAHPPRHPISDVIRKMRQHAPVGFVTIYRDLDRKVYVLDDDAPVLAGLVIALKPTEEPGLWEVPGWKVKPLARQLAKFGYDVQVGRRDQ